MDPRYALAAGVSWSSGRSLGAGDAPSMVKLDNGTAGEEVSDPISPLVYNVDREPGPPDCHRHPAYQQSQSKDGSASLPAILAAFIPSLISATLLLLVFVIIKRPFRRIYSPKTYIDVIPEK